MGYIIPLKKKPKPLIVTQQLIIGVDLYLQLKKLDYDVIGVNTNSDEAIATIIKHQPSVVLIDMGLKGSVNGIQLAKLLIEMYDTPVIFLNPGMDESTFRSALMIQTLGFIHIPYEISDLESLITKPRKNILAFA